MWQWTPFSLPMSLAAILTVASAAFVYARRLDRHAAPHFLFAATTMAVYTLAYTAELSVAPLDWKLFFHRIKWVGVAFTPYSALLLALTFVRRPPPRWVRLVLAVVPVTAIVLELTNEAHWLLESPAVLAAHGAYTLRKQAGNQAFWVFLVFSYLYLLTAMVSYAAAWIAGARTYRRPARLLLLSSLVPWIANILYNFVGVRIHEIDVTPMFFGVTVALWAWAISRNTLLDLVPVARDAVLESLRDPVLVVDARGRVLDATPAAAEVFQAGAPIAIGKALGELLAPWPSLLQSAEARTPHEEWVGDRCLSLRPSKLEGGEGFTLLFADVTDKRRLAEAQESARQAAERAAGARSAFLARMSHEVRTPLHGILAGAELLTKVTSEPAAQRYAQAIVSSSRGLLTLVNDILDFERLAAGHIDVVATAFSPRRVVEEVFELFHQMATSRGLSFEVERAELGADLWLLGDAARLRQVVSNLLSNAIKFTEVGGITLHVSAQEASEANAKVLVIVVSDSGIGMTAEEASRAHEPFVQVDGSVTRRRDGSGLGLTIATQLTEAMGGTLTIDSAKAQGTKVTVRLALPPTAPPPVAHAGAGDEAPAQVVGTHVLLVENHPISRMLLGDLLRSLGCVVTEAPDGERALTSLAIALPQLVITDFHMEGVDGLELARRARARGFDVPIVALTADAREEVREDCLRAGMSGHATKPIDGAGLARLVAVHARVPLAAQASPPAHPDGAPDVYARARALFPDVAAQDLRSAEHLATARDWRGARKVVHGLRGASDMLSVHDISAACREFLASDDVEASAALTNLRRVIQRMNPDRDNEHEAT
jgi:signal transduction histidine kinase/HPt (histidine-containing phosphotransfer) domain-containing protein